MFARILLAAGIQEDIRNIIVMDGISVGPASDIDLPTHWTDRIGSLRMGRLQECGLAIDVKRQLAESEAIQGEVEIVQQRAKLAFLGVLLAANFVTRWPPILFWGSYKEHGKDVHGMSSLPHPTHQPAAQLSTLGQKDLASAACLGRRLIQGVTNGKWRLNRMLNLYQRARCEPDELERIHQYVRTLDGAIKLPRGKGAKEFACRMTDLAGDQCQKLFGELYQRRNAIAHLREDELLASKDRKTRIRLLQDEHVCEFLSRATLARIVNDDTLCNHFGTAAAVDRFWDPACHSSSERRDIWGPPIDPCRALDGFNPSSHSDSDLGL
jgi:hypothetical protein